jgi:hypothetical protein
MPRAARQDPGLFPSEEEIAEEVLGRRARLWKAVAVVLEREGLPRIDPFMGGRYMPAVRAFFDRRYGLRDGNVPSTPDGVETW